MLSLTTLLYRVPSARRLLQVLIVATAVSAVAHAQAGSVSVSWSAPTTNADGTPLKDLRSYRIYLGSTVPACPGSSFHSVAAPRATPAFGDRVSASITALNQGTTYFARITAVDLSGNESGCSSLASGVARADVAVAPAGAVSFGSVAVGSTVVRTLTVQNMSSGMIAGTASSGGPFSVVSGASFLLGPGASQTVTVRFRPTAASNFAGNVNVTASGDTISRGLSGSTTPAAPVASRLSPASTTAGGGGLTLTVTGSRFVASSVVRWNGMARPTAFDSASQLRVALTAADLATARAVPVTVVTPAPGGGYSGSVTFTVKAAPPAAPVASRLSPASTTAGGGGLTLTVTGSRFVASSVVRWNGMARPTAFDSASQLRVALTAADLATARAVPVTVVTPAPGGGYSGSVTFTVKAAPPPAPVASRLSPASTTAGGGGLTLTVTGSRFVASSVVRWNGMARPTAFDSASQLRVALTAADLATARAVPVTVVTPAPGGGYSGSVTFTVKAAPPAAPVASSLSPASITAGSGGLTLTVKGSRFVASSVVRWNGVARPTAFDGASQLRAALTAADLATARAVPVTVVTPAPGGGYSGSVTFTVKAAPPAAPVASSLSPASITAGSGGLTLTVKGSRFVASSVVRWNGVARPTAFDGASQLRAALTAADLATARAVPVTVVTPAPGGGYSGSVTFTVKAAPPAAPVASSLSPASITAGSGGLTLTVKGSRFVASSVVRWNGVARPTAFDGASQLRAALTAADLATARAVPVTVVTPAPGGGYSGSVTFSITAAVPQTQDPTQDSALQRPTDP